MIFEFLLLSFVLFCIGLYGILTRRNILMLFLSTEIMLNALNIALVAIGKVVGNLSGEIFALFVIAIAASEVAIGLGLLLAWYRKNKTIDLDFLKNLKG